MRGDDWLVINRWEQLMSMRETLTFVEMATWCVFFF
jgi:glucan endo-1,3-alpha-glucosidase